VAAVGRTIAHDDDDDDDFAAADESAVSTRFH
jgi:hypothetical protein